MSRGIQNNNPGNIRRSSDPWQGLAAVQSDPVFFTFTGPIWGIRAIARLLVAYQDKYGCHKVNDFINRWAPPDAAFGAARPGDHNPTQAYANNVAAALGVDPGGSFIDVHNYLVMKPMVAAIIRQENGVQPYTDAQLDQGLALAGVVPAERSLAGSRTIQASTVMATGGGLTAATAAASQVSSIAYSMQPLLDLFGRNAALFLVVGGLAIVGAAGYIAYRRWDDHRRLAR